MSQLEKPVVVLDVRILQRALRNAPEALGGPGRYAQGVLNALLHRGDNISYKLLLDYGEIPSALNGLAFTHRQQVSVHRVGFRRRISGLRRGRAAALFDALEWPLLGRQIARLRPDVIHFLDQPAPAVGRRPAIITLYDVWPPEVTLRLRRSPTLKGRFSAMVIRHQLRRSTKADVIVCISKSTAHDAQRLLGISSERLRVIYPGVDTTVFRPDPTAPTDGYGRFAGRKYFMHTGVLGHEGKNPEGLLRAFREVAAERADVQLLSAGPYNVSPHAAALLTSLSTTMGIADRVHVLKNCNDKMLASLYRGAVALVFPSLYEGFGFPVLEALACGTPCVISNVASLPEVGGDLAVFVDPYDHVSIAKGMRRVLEDASHRRRVRALGPEWAVQFSWASAAASIVNVYVELTDDARARSRHAWPADTAKSNTGA
jgi:glycosyltransferase involved in cell wall biosynthesis